jgi:hypothetical protein
MTVGLLITDGGPHPSDKWAEATASHIVQVAEHVAGTKRAAAVKLEAAIIDILEGHHATVQTGERSKLAEHGVDRLSHDLDCGHHLSVDEVIADIQGAAVGTSWEEDFKKAEMVAGLQHLLKSHFHTSMHIERSWHADLNKHMEEAQAFHAKHNVGGN